MPIQVLNPAPSPPPLALSLIDSPRPQAGFPSPAADYAEGTLDLHDYLVSNPVATFYLRVQGDSMVDARIFDGDLLVVDRSSTPRRGQIVVASLRGGDELLVKQYSVVAGVPTLLSRNERRVQDFLPISLSVDDAAEIWGVVVAVVRKF